MKNFKNFGKRGLSLFVALMMSLSMLSVTALADDEITDTPSDPVPVEPVALADEPAPIVATITQEDGTVTGYSTINAAIEAAGENTTINVVVGENATEENPTEIKENVTVGAGKNITLNIPENVTLSNADDKGNTITNNGTLTITGKGTVVQSGKYGNVALFNSPDAKADIKGCTFTSTVAYYVLHNRGTMDIYDGVKATLTGTPSVVVNGWHNGNENTDKKEAVLYIHGGTFTGGWITVKNDDWGNLTIDDGTFECNQDQPDGQKVTNKNAILNWNKATINGGTFKNNDDKFGTIHNAANEKSEFNNGTLTVNGGKFINAGNGGSLTTWKGTDGPKDITGGYYVNDISKDVTKAEVVCIKVGNDTEETPWQVGYLKLTDTQNGATLYTNGTNTATMTPTVQLDNSGDLADLDASKIEWSTSDSSIAAVDKNGNIQAMSDGTVTITATYKVGSKTFTKDYTVTVGTYYAPIVIDYSFMDVAPDDGTTITDAETPLAGIVTLADLLNALWEYEDIENVNLPEDFQWSDHDYAQAIYWGLDEALVIDTEDDPLDPDEIVTVALLREVLENFVEYKGADLTVTVDGEDDMIVMDLGERLTAFYGELEAALEAQAA